MTIQHRNIIASILTAIYMMMAIGPQVSLALKSTGSATVAGECSGNCEICGCSTERRANHTCCCWEKKLRENRGHGCCSADYTGRMHCSKAPILSCGCPCGDVKSSMARSDDQFFYRFSQIAPLRFADTLDFSYHGNVFEHYKEPPDPPPKLVILC
jgi:hypothetical protein